MNPDDFPAPKEGFVITHFLVVSDQDRSREFYKKIFNGTVLIERDPVIMKVANSWIILNVGGRYMHKYLQQTLLVLRDPPACRKTKTIVWNFTWPITRDTATRLQPHS